MVKITYELSLKSNRLQLKMHQKKKKEIEKMAKIAAV